ncbi:hypothetical protein K474DRAFT_489292 [Panus rudis PR-1116 ss-1]|nr:hypothetical protein K474DRAFT_489292 [Panus rudis PR-1116 ss-1]
MSSNNMDGDDSTPRSRIHPASQVDASLHPPALLEMLKQDISRPLLEYAVDCVLETVHYALNTPSSSRGRSKDRDTERAKLLKFITDVVTRAEIKVPGLLVALAYVERAKPHMEIATAEWAGERTFLGALIAANKYTNDSTLKNVHWSLASRVFKVRDIGRIEREFLDVLDFELGITEDEILAQHAALQSYTNPHAHTFPTGVRHSSHMSTTHSRDIEVEVSVPPQRQIRQHGRKGSSWSSNESTLGSVAHLDSFRPTRPATPETSVGVIVHPVLDASTEDVSHPEPVESRETRKRPPTPHPAPPSPTALPSKPHHHHHHRLSSAFNILRSLPFSLLHPSKDSTPSVLSPDSSIRSSDSSNSDSSSSDESQTHVRDVRTRSSHRRSSEGAQSEHNEYASFSGPGNDSHHDHPSVSALHQHTRTHSEAVYPPALDSELDRRRRMGVDLRPESRPIVS